MAPLAEYALLSGMTVSGSDLHPNGVKRLEELGASITPENCSKALYDVDTVVYSSAIPKNHHTMKTAASLGKKLIHRSELLHLSLIHI